MSIEQGTPFTTIRLHLCAKILQQQPKQTVN